MNRLLGFLEDMIKPDVQESVVSSGLSLKVQMWLSFIIIGVTKWMFPS